MSLSISRAAYLEAAAALAKRSTGVRVCGTECSAAICVTVAGGRGEKCVVGGEPGRGSRRIGVRDRKPPPLPRKAGGEVLVVAPSSVVLAGSPTTTCRERGPRPNNRGRAAPPNGSGR